MKPLIGISCSYDHKEGRYFLAEAYVKSIIKAGGLPVILPGAAGITEVGTYLASLQGILLAGGGDVDPAYFDEEPQPGLGEITPERDKFEITLIKGALRKKIPVLGICRGIQVLNVACGGTVIQHIPAEIKKPLKHSQNAPRWYPTHEVFIEKSSLLGQVVKTDTLKVNSFHHQAVKETAPGFKVSSFSSDGIIEAVENPKYQFLLGIQWHPECMTEKDDKSRMLFSAFINAAKNY